MVRNSADAAGCAVEVGNLRPPGCVVNACGLHRVALFVGHTSKNVFPVITLLLHLIDCQLAQLDPPAGQLGGMPQSVLLTVPSRCSGFPPAWQRVQPPLWLVPALIGFCVQMPTTLSWTYDTRGCCEG